MAMRKHPCPKMRSKSRGHGYAYFSGPLKELCEELEQAHNRIFATAAKGFVQGGRGVVQWTEDRLEFIPRARFAPGIDDPKAQGRVAERLDRYRFYREALVFVRRPAGAALCELAAHRPLDNPKSETVVVSASVLWSRGIAASAEEAERRSLIEATS